MVDYGHRPQSNGNGNGYHPHIFVGLSTHDHRVHCRFMQSIMGLVGSGRFKVTLRNTSSGGIQKARNHLAAEYLNKCDASHYLSIDSDIQFHPDHVSRLLSHNLDIVGGLYCHKKPELEWSARALDGAAPDPRTGLTEVTAVGTGFLLIKRGVFETIRAKFPEIAFKEDWCEGRGETKWDFFRAGITQDPPWFPDPTWLSEDFGFCHLARKAGFKIYVDSTFYLTHWEGGRGYPEKPPPREEDQPDHSRTKPPAIPSL